MFGAKRNWPILWLNLLFLPLLAKRVRRVVLTKHLHYLAMSTIIDSPIVHIPVQENSYMAAINAVHHLIDSDGGLLPHCPLSGKVVQHKDLLKSCSTPCALCSGAHNYP
jgi:hypothetical protein